MDIELDIDRYGKDARCSAIADFAEVLAWKKRVCTKATIADLLQRLGRSRYRDRYTGGALLQPHEADGGVDGEYIDDDADDISTVLAGTDQSLVDATWMALRERATILGDCYPFEYTDTKITGRRTDRNGYILLLAITLAHAFKIRVRLKSSQSVEHAFEQTVARCLERKGWTIVPFGTGRASTGGFHAAIKSAQDALGWPLNLDATMRSTKAQDGGLDIVVHIPWGDSSRRTGRVLFLGQVTCAESGEWSQKLSADLVRNRWGPRFQAPAHPSPLPFLAVCHHVENPMWKLLHEEHDGFILDRLRLALQPGCDHLSSDEKKIVAAVRSADLSE